MREVERALALLHRRGSDSRKGGQRLNPLQREGERESLSQRKLWKPSPSGRKDLDFFLVTQVQERKRTLYSGKTAERSRINRVGYTKSLSSPTVT